MSAPASMFDYDKPVAIGNFPNFNSVYSAVGNGSSIQIVETDPEPETGLDPEPMSLILKNETGTKIEYALSNVNSIKSGRSALPQCGEEYATSIELKADEIKNIQALTGALVVNGSEAGTKLRITKSKGDDQLKLSFQGIEAIGNSFDKLYTTDNEDSEIDLTFDPLFFEWVAPGINYKFTVANAEKENSDAVDFIIATGTMTEKEEEIATFNYIAGKIVT